MSYKTWRTGDAARRAGAALAVAGASFALLSSQAALAAAGPPKPPPGAPPIGNNGTVKVHSPGTDAGDHRDEPKVCRFSLAAFGFDPGQQVAWAIQSQSGHESAVVARSTITLSSGGNGSTGVMRLRDGHYKLSFVAIGAVTPGKGGDDDQGDNDGPGKGKGPGHGKGPGRVAVSIAKHKVFKVDCEKDGSKDDADKGKKPDKAPGYGNGNESQAPPPAAGGNPPAQPGSQGDREGGGGALPITGRTIAAISGTGGALILAGIAAIILMRRRGIGPFNAPNAATATAAAGTPGGDAPGGGGTTSITGLFGPLLGPGRPPADPPPAQGPPAPPAGPPSPPRPSP